MTTNCSPGICQGKPDPDADNCAEVNGCQYGCRAAADELTELSEDMGLYDDQPTVCVTHKRFVSCRRDDGDCDIRDDAASVAVVREWQQSVPDAPVSNSADVRLRTKEKYMEVARVLDYYASKIDTSDPYSEGYVAGMTEAAERIREARRG